MKLEAGKKYKTKEGDIVECVAVWAKEINGYQATVYNPVRGFDAYSLDGIWNCLKNESTLDIIAEYKEPKKFEAWVNLYLNGTAEVYHSKEAADSLMQFNRVECRKIEWEVGE